MNKNDVLVSIGGLNKKPDKVTYPIFLENDFFDPSDNVQVKYEMLRANKVEKQKVAHICKKFSYSREAFYVILRVIVQSPLFSP